MECPQRFGLALKSLQQLGAIRGHGWHDLNRDFRSVGKPHRTIDHAHSSTSDAIQNFVAGDLCLVFTGDCARLLNERCDDPRHARRAQTVHGPQLSFAIRANGAH